MIPPPPKGNRGHRDAERGGDPFAEYMSRKDCLVIKRIPKFYNSVNYLSRYFQKFGDIANTSIF